jgi:hypothetical protein
MASSTHDLFFFFNRGNRPYGSVLVYLEATKGFDNTHKKKAGTR